MKISWILLIVAIILAICSDKIDKSLNGNTLIRKVILVFCVGTICIILIPIIFKLLLN